MTEKFDYSVALPYERRRDKDIDGSTMITSTKPFNGGITEQFLYISPKGEIGSITVLFSYPNGLERQYVFQRGELQIAAENRITDFGSISYDKAGTPIRIHPAPFYFQEHAFWRDAPTDEDQKTMEEELERYHEAFEELHERYGEDSIPLEALSDMRHLCPTYDAYSRRLKDLRDFSDFGPTQFVFKNGKWVVVEQVKSMDKTRDVLVVDWDEPFLHDGKRFAISRVGNQLVFHQESLGGSKKKIVQAPLQVDYRSLQSVMGNPVDWEKISEVYPANFYAEL